MRNASSQQGKNEQQWEKKNAKLEHKQQNLWWAHTTFFSIKCVTRKFQVVVVQNNGKEMYKETKKCAACAKFFFLLLIRDYWFFCSSRCRRRLALLDFIFRLSNL